MNPPLLHFKILILQCVESNLLLKCFLNTYRHISVFSLVFLSFQFFCKITLSSSCKEQISVAGFFPILQLIGLTCKNCFWSLFLNCYSVFPYLLFKLFAYYMAHFQISVYNSVYIFNVCTHIMKWTIRFL